MDGGTPDHVEVNVAAWQAIRDEQLEVGRRNWAAPEPKWGIFGIPESLVGLLPRDVQGRDVVELGCGTGYVSAWLARRGALPVALDPTPGQLGDSAGSPTCARDQLPARPGGRGAGAFRR